jgi:hypothetical protein
MRHTKTALKTTVLLTVILFLFNCNPLENDSKSSSMLLVLSIMGTDNDRQATNFLESDVFYEGTVYADVATATFTAHMLDPNFGATSQYNNIHLTRYVVTYSLPDGRNAEGKDVPYSFEGALSAAVEIDRTIGVSFIVVRAVAKQEPPLRNLRGAEGDVVLQATAKIDFYGQDTVGKAVKATGYLTIFFADYGDYEEPPPPSDGDGG